MKTPLMIGAALVLAACATAPATQNAATSVPVLMADASEAAPVTHIIAGAPEDATRYCHKLRSKRTGKAERVCATKAQWLDAANPYTRDGRLMDFNDAPDRPIGAH